MDHPRLVVASLVVAGILSQSGCGGQIQTVRRTTVPPSDTRSVPRDAFLKTHMKDGTVYVLSPWKILDGDSGIEGVGQHLDVNRANIASGNFRVPRDSIILVETNVLRRSPAMTAYTVLMVATVATAIVCITHPKTCFGSCPTFYLEDDPSGIVQAEAFSASVAPFLEDTDVDALYRARPHGKTMRLRVTNEALETHVIRHADVLALPRPESGRVARDGEGGYYEIRDLEPPRAAIASEGDCAPALSSFDRVERFSLADSTDLAMREALDIEFPESPHDRLGLVIAARQTLLTTYLYYQTLAYLGSTAGFWFAELERGHSAIRSRLGGLGEAMGGIEVWVLGSNGSWVLAGTAGETGPIAADVYLVRLPRDVPQPPRVQLRMARGTWRLDYVGLASVGDIVAPVRITPANVYRDGVPDEDALEALTKSKRPLVTYPGDEYVIEYPLPTHPDHYEYFLEARGYYMEWMRREWMKEESPERLRQVFLDPPGTLRRLAPEFKAVEPQMESLFWASRYVKR